MQIGCRWDVRRKVICETESNSNTEGTLFMTGTPCQNRAKPDLPTVSREVEADSERECRSFDVGDLGLRIMMVIVYVGQPITAINQSHLGTVKGADPRSELRDHHVGRRRLVLSPRLGNGKSCIHAEFNFMLEFILSSLVGIFSMERNHLW